MKLSKIMASCQRIVKHLLISQMESASKMEGRGGTTEYSMVLSKPLLNKVLND